MTEKAVADADEKCRRGDAVLSKLPVEEMGGQQQLQVPLETQLRGLHLQEHDEEDNRRGAVVVVVVLLTVVVVVVVVGLTRGVMTTPLK